MIKTLIDHTIDPDLLPEQPVVLDVGCRGFAWDREILKLRPMARIIALDPDPSIECPEDLDMIQFMRCALTEKANTGSVVWQGPGEGAYICANPGDPGYGWGEGDPRSSAIVPNLTITELITACRNIKHFDVVKLDCEGSEFGILENWPGPIATQISVEFHDFIDRNRWNEAYFDKLFTGPLNAYKVELFRLTPIGPANSMGHWDSLLVLR